MSNFIQGRVVYRGETMQVTDSFRKRSLILVTGEDRGYNEYFRAEAVQDNVSRLDPINVNDLVRVHYFLGGQKEVKLDRNNEPSAICSIKISSIEKIGADPNGPIPDILRTQGTAPAQPMQNQGQTNQQWMDQQHAQQQGYQQQGYGAAPQQPAQQQGWGQAQAPQAAPQQGWPQPTQQQGPPPGTIPPTSSPV